MPCTWPKTRTISSWTETSSSGSVTHALINLKFTCGSIVLSPFLQVYSFSNPESRAPGTWVHRQYIHLGIRWNLHLCTRYWSQRVKSFMLIRSSVTVVLRDAKMASWLSHGAFLFSLSLPVWLETLVYCWTDEPFLSRLYALLGDKFNWSFRTWFKWRWIFVLVLSLIWRRGIRQRICMCVTVEVNGIWIEILCVAYFGVPLHQLFLT